MKHFYVLAVKQVFMDSPIHDRLVSLFIITANVTDKRGKDQ